MAKPIQSTIRLQKLTGWRLDGFWYNQIEITREKKAFHNKKQSARPY
jgi:hypothetical protein